MPLTGWNWLPGAAMHRTTPQGEVWRTNLSERALVSAPGEAFSHLKADIRAHSPGPGSAHTLIPGVPRIARPAFWTANPQFPVRPRRDGWNAVVPGARIACLPPRGERPGPDLKPGIDYHRRSLMACRNGPSGQPPVRSRPDPARRGRPVRMGREFPSENARAMTTSLARAPFPTPNDPPMPDVLALARDGKESIRAEPVRNRWRHSPTAGLMDTCDAQRVGRRFAAAPRGDGQILDRIHRRIRVLPQGGQALNPEAGRLLANYDMIGEARHEVEQDLPRACYRVPRVGDSWPCRGVRPGWRKAPRPAHPTADESLDRLHRASWSVGDIGTATRRVVSDNYGENLIDAEEATRAEAWWKVCEQATGRRMLAPGRLTRSVDDRRRQSAGWWVREGYGVASGRLSDAETGAKALPPVCIHCGSPVVACRARHFALAHGAAWLCLLGAHVEHLLHFALTKRATVWVPLTQRYLKGACRQIHVSPGPTRRAGGRRLRPVSRHYGRGAAPPAGQGRRSGRRGPRDPAPLRGGRPRRPPRRRRRTGAQRGRPCGKRGRGPG
jgi:hypothetical protein